MRLADDTLKKLPPNHQTIWVLRSSHAPRRRAERDSEKTGRHICRCPPGEEVTTFLDIASELDSATYWWLLRRKVWSKTEQIPRDLWTKLLEAHPGDRPSFMSVDERAALAQMPSELHIYRGAGNETHIPGFSWTLQREIAEFFARRYVNSKAMFRLSWPDPQHPLEPIVVEGAIAKDDVIGYLVDGEEEEIVALPHDVHITAVERLPVAAEHPA